MSEITNDPSELESTRAGRRHRPLVSKTLLHKNIGVIHSSSTLGLVERKLFNWLLRSSFDRLLIDDTHELPLPMLKLMMGWERSNNNEGIELSLKRLMSTVVHFNLLPTEATPKDGRRVELWEATTLLSYATVIGGKVGWRFDRAMAEKLKDPFVYHTLNLASAQGLQSVFAYALYENTARYVQVGKTANLPIPLLRELLNASAPLYDDFRYLKQRVITPSVREINTITDITIEPIYERHGRSVVAVQFKVSEKQQSSLLKQKTRTLPDLNEQERQLHDRMVALGLQTKAAISMIETRPAQVIAASIEITEQKLRSGEIVRSAAAYLRKVVAAPLSDAITITSATYQRSQAEQGIEATASLIEAQRAQEVIARTERDKRTTEIALMSLEQKRAAANDFIAQNPARLLDFDSERVRFGSKNERLFQLFLRGWKATDVAAETPPNQSS